MKNLLVTYLLLIGIFCLYVSNLSNKQLLIYILCIAVAANEVYSTKSIIKRELTGELNIKESNTGINYGFLLIALLWTVTALIPTHIDNSHIAFLFWCMFIADIISKRQYNKSQAFSIVVKKDGLIINKAYINRRSIKTLKEIKLNGLTDNIKLIFSNKPSITISRQKYSDEKIFELLSYLSRNSNETLIISENLIEGITAANIRFGIIGA